MSEEPVYEDQIIVPLGSKPPHRICVKRPNSPFKGYDSYFVPSMCKMYDKDMKPLPLPKNWRKTLRIKP